MTPTEMIRQLYSNVTRAHAAMEDGATGYVLHTSDYVHMLCQTTDGNGTLGSPYLGEPLDDNAITQTSINSAEVLKRYWNSFHPDRFNSVVISLRRDALAGYIVVQQKAIEALTQMEGATQ
jgi:hypothetical protein